MRLVVTSYVDFKALTTALSTKVDAVMYKANGTSVDYAIAIYAGGVIYMPRNQSPPLVATFTTDYATAVAAGSPFTV